MDSTRLVLRFSPAVCQVQEAKLEKARGELAEAEAELHKVQSEVAECRGRKTGDERGVTSVGSSV